MKQVYLIIKNIETFGSPNEEIVGVAETEQMAAKVIGAVNKKYANLKFSDFDWHNLLTEVFATLEDEEIDTYPSIVDAILKVHPEYDREELIKCDYVYNQDFSGASMKEVMLYETSADLKLI